MEKSRNWKFHTVKDQGNTEHGKGRFQNDNCVGILDGGRRLECPEAISQDCLTIIMNLLLNLENLAINQLKVYRNQAKRMKEIINSGQNKKLLKKGNDKNDTKEMVQKWLSCECLYNHNNLNTS